MSACICWSAISESTYSLILENGYGSIACLEAGEAATLTLTLVFGLGEGSALAKYTFRDARRPTKAARKCSLTVSQTFKTGRAVSHIDLSMIFPTSAH
jgi:hypothetical protein